MKTFYECGSCGSVHPIEFTGDCRDDANRFNIGELDEALGAFNWELVPMPGFEVRHDMLGYYACTFEEAEHEDAGNASVGFDGRPHFKTIEEAAEYGAAR